MPEDATPNEQTALDEVVVEDADLEKLLNDRLLAHGAKGEATKKFKTLHDAAMGRIQSIGLEDGQAARVGRFRVSKTAVAARSVSFDTAPTSRLTIGTVSEEEE